MAAEQVESEAESKICLPAGWKPALPVVDQQWIAKALFRWSQCGQPELNFSKVDKMWWYPPQPALEPSGMPAMERYFGHPLFLWMPRKLWRVRLFCPHPDCGQNELIFSGVHQMIRQVVGVSSSYFIAAEHLACKTCKRKVISWSHDIICQLDVGHRVQFPCLLTGKLACDIQVVRQMRQRGLWNSSSQIQKHLEEQHSDAWLQKEIQFLSDCRGLMRAAPCELITPVSVEDLPALLTVPKHRWLKQVCVQDVLHRLEEIKASITSLFGRILKMDSTKKNVRKMAGQSHAATSWATNISNEHGQVIMSVLTVSEGYGLGKMINGIIRRYQDAGVSPPDVLYVDRDCCGSTHLRSMFWAWQDMEIRLDIWHFMKSIAVGCTSDSHLLYTGFMRCLSHCIFKWDEGDLQALKEAKLSELEARLMHPTDAGVMQHITGTEMALHCKRVTRSCRDIETLVTELIQAYDGEKGHSDLGMPLINSVRMAEIWKAQKKHIACIQDPPGVQLYMKTGTIVKGGHTVPMYRCVRGCTSLESWNLHVNIPGTVSCDTVFQAYLLDGLARWNEDRTMAAARKEEPHCYSGVLRHTANQLAQEVLGRNLMDYTRPQKHTGELLGMEYLYEQTGSALKDYKLAIAELETEDVSLAENEVFIETREFENLTVPAFETAVLSSVPAAPAMSPAVPSASDATLAFSTNRETSPSPLAASAASPTACSATSRVTPPAAPPDIATSAPQAPAAPEATHLVTPPATSSVALDIPLSHIACKEEPVTSDLTSALVASPSLDDSIVPNNFAASGYGAVQELADYLVSLKDHSLILTRDESSHIIALWQAMSDYDKKGPERPQCQTSLYKGPIRPTKQTVTPGVESTRCPAKRPDCNRVVEVIFIRLVQFTKWSLIIWAYKHIRDCILSNAHVMQETTIHLPKINAATLSEWYTRSKRSQEADKHQGLRPPDAPVSSTVAQSATHPKENLITHSKDNPHVLPLDTTGMAKTKRHLIIGSSPFSFAPPQEHHPAAVQHLPVTSSSFSGTVSVPEGQVYLSTVPRSDSHVQVLVPRLWHILPATANPAKSGSSQVTFPATQMRDVPYTTLQYRKRKMKREKAGVHTRKYVRHSDTITCKKCKKERKPPTHQQYFGNWYCEETATVSFVDWKATLAARGYGKKKDPK